MWAAADTACLLCGWCLQAAEAVHPASDPLRPTPQQALNAAVPATPSSSANNYARSLSSLHSHIFLADKHGSHLAARLELRVAWAAALWYGAGRRNSSDRWWTYSVFGCTADSWSNASDALIRLVVLFSRCSGMCSALPGQEPSH
jgi:hypothetical protein